MDVVSHRVAAEGLPLVPERMTVYISPNDRAITVAGWFFDSISRIGQLPSTLLTENERKGIEKIPRLEIVDAQVGCYGIFGHSDLCRNPAVSPDLLSILVDSKFTTRFHGRPGPSPGDFPMASSVAHHIREIQSIYQWNHEP